MRKLLLLTWLLPATVMAAGESPQQNATARLEEQTFRHSLQVHPIADDGTLLISGNECLDAQQRQGIEQSLLRSPRVRSVDWRLQCDSPIVPAAYRVVREGDDALALLPEDLLFKPIYADPREARFAVRVQQHRLDGQSFLATDLALGATLGIASGGGERGKWQLGIQGAVFALFDLESNSTDLVNSDFWFGIPFNYRIGDWSLRARLYHQSSHLGDEYILRDRTGTRRLNISYEVLDGLLAYDWGNTRIFAGGGYLLHSLHQRKRWLLQYGFEHAWPGVLGSAGLVVATNFQHQEEQDWHWNQSYRIGFALQRGVRETGVFLAHYDGYAPDGQFYKLRLEYSGLEVFYRF